MKIFRSIMTAVVLVFTSTYSVASTTAPYSVQISEVEVNNNGLYIDANGNAEPAIFVRGVFTPALPCPQQGFFLIASDPLLQETVAIIIAAKAAGTPLGYNHVYCYSNGYSRGDVVSAQ